MAYELENIVREWMDHLKGLNVGSEKDVWLLLPVL